MSPCDYINLGYHGLLITMVSFSTWWSDPRRHGWIPLHLEAQAEDQKHIPLQKSWKKEEEWGISNRPSALSCEALLLLGVGDSPGDESQPRTQSCKPEALDTKTGIKRKAEEQPLTPTQTIITKALSQGGRQRPAGPFHFFETLQGPRKLGPGGPCRCLPRIKFALSTVILP